METFLCNKLQGLFDAFSLEPVRPYYFLTGVTSLQMGPGFPVTIPSLSVAADHYNKVQVS